jgi:pimeloyl-ACP methyl ester carboxylesterase
MISHLPLRLAAICLAPLLVLRPDAAHCQTAPAAAVTMDHISITSVGSGSPVVLIPGLSSPRAVWEGVVPDLAKTHRVHVVQVNGFDGGDPRANVQPGVLDGIVGDLDAYIAKAKLKAPAVVGHSLGGLLGLMLAKAHPNDLSKLMVVDSLPYVGEIFLRGATVAMVEPQAKAMRDQIVASYGKPANAAQAEATANGLAKTPDARAKVKAWALAADPRVTGQALYEDMTTDLRPDIAAIATPITAIYPAPGDDLYHAAYGKAPKVTYVPVADTAHFVMLDQPAAFATALNAFLDTK